MAWRKRRAATARNTEPEISFVTVLLALLAGAALGIGIIGLLILLAKIIY